MKVSIIVPVYNVYDYIKKCLESLVNQTIVNYEIIVVNDGSPDNSQEIIDKYVRKYPDKVKSFIKKNGGLSDARNYGVTKASGDYIIFIDSDDYIKNDMIELMYNYAIDNSFDIVLCDTIMKNDKTEYVLKSNLHLSNNDINNYVLAYPMACIRLIKKNIMKKRSFKKNILYEDLELMPSLILETNKIGFLDYAGYYYVQRSGSIMQQTEFNDKFLDIFKVLEANKDKIGKKYPEEVEYLYITHLLRSATIRFLNFKDTKVYLNKINQTIKKYYPNWRKNIYYKKSGIKLKIICRLAYNSHYSLLKIIKKISGR